MKRLVQGIQAVTVELLGVLLVVWMLFGFTALGLHSASGRPPTLGSDVAQQLSAWKDRIATRLFRNVSVESNRREYVAHRLSYFSHDYSLAARNHVEQLMGEFDRAAVMKQTAAPIHPPKDASVVCRR